MEEPVISIPLRGSHTSSAINYLSRTSGTSNPPCNESDLLKSIRTALRGSDTESISIVQSTSFLHESDPWEEDELTWNAHAVILSCGGVMKKKWNFEEERQSIQWACIGWLEQDTPAASVPSHRAAHYASNLRPAPRTSAERPTFGPFAQVQQNASQDLGFTTTCVASVFVFLRSIGKIYSKNGLEYTFSLPFIVRKAWALSPHGVMIQRVLEPSELDEAEISGDAVLPTIFSVTSPFSEAGTVGLTTGIVGGFHGTAPSLKDEDENSTKPLKSVAPTEMVVWASHRGPASKDDILVTVDVGKGRLSVWRYVYIKPKDSPVPFCHTRVRAVAKKRSSMTGIRSHRSSAVFSDVLDRRAHPHPASPDIYSREQLSTSGSPVFSGLPPLSALHGMAPSLLTTTTMASLVGGSAVQWSAPSNGRRNSLTRNDLSVTMDRMVLGGRMDVDVTLAPIEHGRMKAAYWMERISSIEIDTSSWQSITVSLFDDRWDGTTERSLLAICLPSSQTLNLLSLVPGEDNMLKATPFSQISAISATSLRMTRANIWDLLIVKPDHQLSILTHGTSELPIDVTNHLDFSTRSNDRTDLQAVYTSLSNSTIDHGEVTMVQGGSFSTATLIFEDGWQHRTTIDLVPQDNLTVRCLQILALTLPSEVLFTLHRAFLEKWSSRGLSTSDGVEFECFTESLYETFDLVIEELLPARHMWTMLARSASHRRFREDRAFKKLSVPFTPSPIRPSRNPRKHRKFLATVLYALHTLGEDLRLMVHHYQSLVKLAPIICRIAFTIRPEWADYWKRLCPNATEDWPSPETALTEHFDDRIPVWPPDISAILYGRISNPDWQVPWYGIHQMAVRFGITPAFAYGRLDPLVSMYHLTEMYRCLSDKTVSEAQRRAENAMFTMVTSQLTPDFLNRLPIGIAAPIREAARTCQLAPPGDWPLAAYRAIGRNDLAASASDAPDMLFSDGYKPTKDFIGFSRRRRTFEEIVNDVRALGSGEIDDVSGVEIDLADFTDIRFGQDRRLEEVARMLCSSSISSVRIIERPELNEHDQAKEHQNQAVRIAERTLALPYGRAMFTFGSIPTVTREAYTIPRIQYTVRVQPHNVPVTPETGKISMESLNWGDFHNGVAAGLRISPSSGGVESSWIAFNKPSDLTPEHAGFLFGLGLTGHLKEMLTWHTFGYLTPKHDLTSIGVLLGLSAANVGSGNQHVTKLLAVHTPALLPTPTVDLNVSLMTQAAGLAGVGLLYLGSKNRRMAEVCLNQISRKDLVQPDLSNEHREAYTYSAALAFGMIMLGTGTSIPADMTLLSRLGILVHGDANVMFRGNARPPFDINLTSPAATIAIGLMYLRTERQDIADILTIPDTVLALNRIQPSFLLIRTIARSLIMWNSISPTSEWLISQLPVSIREAIDAHSKGKLLDDALELAYYNILAGSCFVVGLKYAGTARQAAYMMIIRYFDMFTRLVYSNGLAFDHKIKRSAYRDGLNLISISLSMVMAGTGEITCFRRLRYAYGMYQQAMYHHPFKYGIHVATHMSLGLLFLGGGRFTLGTSDAAVACMVTAFFPRFHHLSSDNKSYLQALRHLWVLAVEPRCLIARDVDTNEVVYLPVKITMKDGSEIGTTQLISPTLIPDLDKLLSIRVDTPRYWPFYLDTEHIPRHKQSLLRSQTLFVKRRTAFLSYTEDPRGSRSLFVRSGSSAGDSATLDFPQLMDARTHPAGDLSEFISSFSNDVLFLAFADHFSRDAEVGGDRLFHIYCHAALLDSILQDKPQTLQSHLTLFHYRTMSQTSQYFHLRLQDLRFAADFYSKIYDRRFSGRAENNPRPPLIRDSTVAGALHALDGRLNAARSLPQFIVALRQYARGETITKTSAEISRSLAWYLLRNGVPVSTLLIVLRGLAHDAHTQCLGLPPPEGTGDSAALDLGIKEVLHGTGTRMTTALGSGWSVRSLDEIIEAWELGN